MRKGDHYPFAFTLFYAVLAGQPASQPPQITFGPFGISRS